MDFSWLWNFVADLFDNRAVYVLKDGRRFNGPAPLAPAPVAELYVEYAGGRTCVALFDRQDDVSEVRYVQRRGRGTPTLRFVPRDWRPL